MALEYIHYFKHNINANINKIFQEKRPTLSYSVLKATIGSNLDALKAGYIPLSNPTPPETKKAIPMLHG